MGPFENAEVTRIFEEAPAEVKKQLHLLRKLVFKTARKSKFERLFLTYGTSD